MLASSESCFFCAAIDHRHGPVEMLPALFRGELVGQLASFGGQPAAGSFFRVVELLLRDAGRRSHNKPNLPFPEGVVNSGMILCQQVSL
jgi:hypothetical protein